ncbi:MAG: hypothetical protein LBF43_03870 [Puniceicoccales bacterium]|jgi:hypothetical protein|nr:hypothetical protein [Puniceicoccales bacterium]
MIRLILRDPGTFFALGNTCLFALVSPLAFVVMLMTLVFIILSRWPATCSRKNLKGFWGVLQQAGNNPCWGLEMMGYACLVVALFAMINEAFVGFICSVCFGFANLLMAHRLNKGILDALPSFEKILKEIKCTRSLTPLLLALLKEPIVLIALGMLYAGLAAGGASLWAFPLICLAPYFAMVRRDMNRAIPQVCLSMCALWYALVGMANAKFCATIANICFAVAYLEIALQEHRLYLKSEDTSASP